MKNQFASLTASKLESKLARRVRRAPAARLHLEDLEIRNLLSAATHLAFLHAPADGYLGTVPTVTVDLLDATEAIDNTNTSMVTLSLYSGSTAGALISTVSAQAVAGVATFSNLNIAKAGSYVIKATDGTLTAVISPAFKAAVPVAHSLVFLDNAADNTAGSALSTVHVQILDQYGNLFTLSSQKVTLQLAGTDGKLLGTTTVKSSAGVATFSGLALNKAGDFTLKAVDGAISQNAAASFHVTAPAVATKLVFTTQPHDDALSALITTPANPIVVVSIEDQYNNVITTDKSTVSLKLHGTDGKLIGTTTIKAVNGVATFSDLAVSKAGATLLIDATDASLKLNATSGSFTVAAPAAASKLVFTTQPADNAAGATLPSIVVKVENASDQVITSDKSTITLKLHGTDGKLIGVTTVKAVNGVATFPGLSVSKAGAALLIDATDAALKLNATSSSFTVTAPSVATKLVFTTQPANNAAVLTITTPIVVKVEDQYDNVIASDKSKVTLKLHGTDGKLIGVTTVKAVNGVATFPGLSVSKAGAALLIDATDASLKLNATSNSFSVTAPSVATKLVFTTQPASIIAGTAFASNVVVKVEDQYDNVITSGKAAVTLKLHGTDGKLIGTSTIKAVNGVATFPGLSLTKAGTFNIDATVASLKLSATSSSFQVIPAAADHLAFAQIPTAAAHAGPFTVLVDVLDKFGNIATADTSSVKIESTTKPTGATNVSTTLAAVAGVATFSGVTFSTAGTYKLTATDGTLDLAVSKSFILT